MDNEILIACNITHNFTREEIIHNFFGSNDINIYVPSNSTSGNTYICNNDYDSYVFRFTNKYGIELADILVQIITHAPKVFPEIITIDKSYEYYVEEYLPNFKQSSFADLLDPTIIKMIVNNICTLHNFSDLCIDTLCSKFTKKLYTYKLSPFCNNDDLCIFYRYIDAFDESIKLIDPSKISYYLVCSHNDVHIGNIMIKNDMSEMRLIDPEYMTLNHWLYDYANLLEEIVIYSYADESESLHGDSIDCPKSLCDDSTCRQEKLILNNKKISKNNFEIIENNILDEISLTYSIEKSFLFELMNTIRIYPNIWWYLWAIEKYHIENNYEYIDYANMRLARLKKLINKH